MKIQKQMKSFCHFVIFTAIQHTISMLHTFPPNHFHFICFETIKKSPIDFLHGCS